MATYRKNYEKNYYDKLNEKFSRISEQSRYYQEILNATSSGKTEIYQKRIKETQVFDASWVETAEDYLHNIDKIVRNPRRYMVAEENVVQIERAKKINSRSVQHLSSHTQFVQEFRDDGTVIPSKILSTTYEDQLEIYENRFVMTLIKKLATFVEIRYSAVKDNIQAIESNRLNVSSDFKWRNFNINCAIDIKVSEEIDDEINRKNKEILERIITIRNYTHGFMNSQFYKDVKEKAAPVHSPILRTNIILKQVDYNACLKLWMFLDSYRQLGFTTDVYEKNLEFDDSYKKRIYDMIIYNYSLMVANQEERDETYRLKPYRYKEIQPAKEVLTLANENLAPGHDDMEGPSANEYFYQRSKKQFKTMYTEMIKSGKGYNATVTSLYRKMQGISNSIYTELFQNLEKQVPKDAPLKEKRKAKFATLRREKTVLNSIVYAKDQDLKNTKRKLERVEAELEKFRKHEDEYQALLKEARKEQLRKAREERKNLTAEERAAQAEEKKKQEELKKLAKKQENKIKREQTQLKKQKELDGIRVSGFITGDEFHEEN